MLEAGIRIGTTLTEKIGEDVERELHWEKLVV